MSINLKKILLVVPLIIFIFAIPLQSARAATPFPELMKTILMNFPLSSPATVGSIAALTLVDASLNSVANLSPNNVALAIVQATIDAFQQITRGLLNLCYKFLEMVTGSAFLGAKITSDNDIVTEGWSIVRNLANIALVFGLIVIAISIILGYQEGKAKRTLVNFIIIAVLINFTPIICGLIIDASNALMSSFIAGAISSNYFVTGGDKILEAVKGNPDNTNLFVYFLIMSIFYLCCAVLIFLYVVLFILRYVVLWILVIASPLAFASKVFPVDSAPIIRRILPGVFFWDEWWNQFLQWCTIGITASFFLYLGNVIGNNISIVTGKISDLFAYLVPFFFLLCGWSVSISSGGFIGAASSLGAEKALNALGAQALVGKIKSGATSWVKRETTRTAKGAIAGMATGVTSGTGIASGGLRGAFTATGREEGARWFTRQERAIKSTIGIGQMKPEDKKFKDLSLEELHDGAARNAFTEKTGKEKAEFINELVNRGEINDTELTTILGNVPQARTWGVNLRGLSKVRPDLAPRLGVYASMEAALESMNNKERNNISSTALANTDFLTLVAGNPNYQQLLRNKLQGRNVKRRDIENIRNGYMNLLNLHVAPLLIRPGPFVDPSIHGNNLRIFTHNGVNAAAIRGARATLDASGNHEAAEALQILTALARTDNLRILNQPYDTRTALGHN